MSLAVRERMSPVSGAVRRASDRVWSLPGGRGFSWLVAAIVVWLLLARTLPHGAPAGIVIQGVVLGAINGLVALVVVLVWRSSRVLNFAAANMGAVAGVLAIELHIKLNQNYFVCVATGLVAAAAVGALVELFIMRRFSNASRLIASVATIGISQVLYGLSVLIPVEWNKGNNSGNFSTPFNIHFTISPVLFNGNYVAAMVIVPIVMAALTVFFRYSSYGVAIRAAADNGDRARLLGIPVKRLSTIVWTITGILSALAILLRVPIQGFSAFNSVSNDGTELLLFSLTAMVIANMTNLPVVVLASIALGVLDSLGAWTFQNSSLVDALLLVVIVLALLAKRQKLSRAADTGITTWQMIKQVRPIPPELMRFRQVRLVGSGVRMVVLAFAVTLPLWETPAHTMLSSLILLYAIVAASLLILTGWGGFISLGHIAFMGLGAGTVVSLMANAQWSFFPALAAGAAVAGVFAFILGVPALRIGSQIYLAVVTLALAVTCADYFFVPKYFPWFATTKQITRAPIFGRLAVDTDQQYYFVCLIALAVVLAAVRGLRNSHAGRASLATSDNRQATQSFGINTTRLNLFAFAASGALAGLAGGLFAVLDQGFSTGSFDANDGLNFFLMVVIGGLGSLSGAVLGAVYVYGAAYLLPSGGWSFLATGFGVLIVLMFFPGGLGELVFRARDWFLRRFAERHEVLVPSLVADVRTDVYSQAGRDVPDDVEAELAHGLAAVEPSSAEPTPLPLEPVGDRK
ncbi:MAG TPA: ABC transporter permease [Acidimicrobiales bacterium]|nr:ABC transporter permease [Acidimicrobiales bacterium]